MNYVPVTMEYYSKREEARNCNKRGKVMNRLPQQVSDTNAPYSIEISVILKLPLIWAVLRRSALWDCFEGRTFTQLPLQLCNNQ